MTIKRHTNEDISSISLNVNISAIKENNHVQ